MAYSRTQSLTAVTMQQEMDGKPIYRSKKKMGKRVGGGFVPKKED